MNRNKALKNAFIALLISIITLLVISSFTGTQDILKLLKAKNLSILLFSFGIFFLVMIIDSLRTIIISKILGYNIGFFVALRNSILFYFISDITPLAAGGQPYQIYHYTKYGLKGSDSTNIVISRFVEYIFTSTIIGFIGYIYLRSSGVIGLIGKGSSLFLLAFIMSIFSGLFVLIPMIYPKSLLYFSKFLNFKFVGPLLKFFKIKADKIETFMEDNIEKFDLSMKTLWKKNLYVMFVDILLGFVDILLQALSLYVVFRWFGIEVTYLHIFGIFVLLNLVVYYVPTPGASGGLESVYLLIFYNMLNASKIDVMSSIALWRIATFYFVIIIGFVVFIMENTMKGVQRNEDSSACRNV